MDSNSNKRTILIIAGAVDAFIGAIILLIYFDFLPIDISGWGISRPVIGLIGGAWFFAALGFLAYLLFRTDSPE